MSFTKSCFIHKNTPELRGKLEKFGLVFSPEEVDKPDAPEFLRVYLSHGEEKISSIDCGENEKLFLALAATRGNTDKSKWFTDGIRWEICPDEIADKNTWASYYHGEIPHEATVPELIEHFKTK